MRFGLFTAALLSAATINTTMAVKLADVNDAEKDAYRNEAQAWRDQGKEDKAMWM